MKQRITRRNFARLMGLSASVAALPAAGTTPRAHQAETTDPRTFPKGFLWGTATSAYQIEGATHEEGRGPSIWDTFLEKLAKSSPTPIDNAEIADDEFHRYREDIALMRDLGVQTYQFSLAWPRIFPNGTGAPNPQGWAFYDRMLDSLLEAGIEPFCTLYHWDLPAALMSNGGWQSKDTAKALADYSAYAVRHLSDRVKNFITISEIGQLVDGGYRYGSDAPGLKLTNAQVAQVNHNVLLGHGMAVQAIRANARPGTRVGIADNAVSTIPVIETPENIAAARTAYREENARSLTAMMEGRYTDLYLKRLGPDAPKFTPEEMKIISSPMDFVGLNVYEPTWVRALDTEPGYEILDLPPSYPHTAALWLQLGPGGMYWSPKFLHEIWNVSDIFITENGAASTDLLNKTGEVLDVDRIFFLRSYLAQLQRGISEGVPVKGYFLWSLIDNYEWTDGYPMRFGIVYVDFKTQKRTPKLSAEFYKRVIATNSLA